MQRKHLISVLLCSVAILASCTDVWEEHYQPNPQLNADETLWELIKNDPELEKFEKFLIETKYDSLLMKNRFYTVWAPVGDFDYNEKNRELWEREFVQNHIADYSHVAGGKLAEDNFVTMLNGKYIRFENSKGKFTFQGLPLTAQNIPAKNGVLHKINGYVDYLPNIWEQLAKETGADGVDSLYQFLFKDFKREFDSYSSVPGPTVDGKLTYLDSVFTESNPWFYDLGDLNREDSSYTMFALTNTAWVEMRDNALTYFKYATGYAGTEDKPGVNLDSIRNAIVYELMCKNLVFSDKVNAMYLNGNAAVPYDKLISNYRLYYGNKNSLVFEGDEVATLYEGVKTKKMSNGTLHIMDQVNYAPLKCWHDTIRSEAEYLVGYDPSTQEGKTNPVEYDFTSIDRTIVRIDEDSVDLYERVSGGAVAVFAPKTETSDAMTLKFEIRNVLSAPYRIKIVTLPPQVINPADTLFIRPTMFYAQLQYAHEDDIEGNGTLKLCASETMGHDTIMVSCEDLDTIVLCPFDGSGHDYVKVPVCEFEESSHFGSSKTQTLLEINVFLPSGAAGYRMRYLAAIKSLMENEIRLGVAKRSLLAAEEKYQAALESGEVDSEVLEEYLEEVEDYQKDIERLHSDIEENKEDVEKYGKNANYDNVLRIDQVIFEPIAL